MKVTISLTLDTRLSDDIRVMYARAMQGSETVACQHPLTMEFLRGLPKLIDNAAGYQRAIDQLSRKLKEAL